MMLWFYDEPSNDPYVSLTVDVTIEPALAFLDAFAREHGTRAGVQHLVTAAVARCLHEFPALNVKILAGGIYQLERIDIAVPVQLEGGSSARDQTGMVVVQGVDGLSLGEIAAHTRKRVAAERAGEHATTGTAGFRKLAATAPRVAGALFGAASRLLQRPIGQRLISPWLSVSAGVTNIGAVFPMPPGARFRSAGLTMPTKLGHVASAFALAPACDAPVAEEGRVVVRRVLPIVMLVDHRAIDGYLMAKLGARLAELLLAPAALAHAAH